MWRQGARYIFSGPLHYHQWKKNQLSGRGLCCSSSSSSSSVVTTTSTTTTTTTDDNNKNNSKSKSSMLSLEEVKKILNEVKADDIRIFPAKDRCSWTDFMVFVTGRSAWHVRNIAQALLFQAKQKQRGAERMLLPSVEGEKEGKWIVIDSGTIVIHALDEKARAYYNLERLWEREISTEDQNQDLGKAFVKVRRINNSKKPQVFHGSA